MPRMRKIVEAEVAPVEETKEPVVQDQNMFNLNDVGEMVMVGRLKNGKEFVRVIHFDDVLKARQYIDWGAKYFDAIIERAIYNELYGSREQK